MILYRKLLSIESRNHCKQFIIQFAIALTLIRKESVFIRLSPPFHLYVGFVLPWLGTVQTGLYIYIFGKHCWWIIWWIIRQSREKLNEKFVFNLISICRQFLRQQAIWLSYCSLTWPQTFRTSLRMQTQRWLLKSSQKFWLLAFAINSRATAMMKYFCLIISFWLPNVLRISRNFSFCITASNALHQKFFCFLHWNKKKKNLKFKWSSTLYLCSLAND